MGDLLKSLRHIKRIYGRPSTQDVFKEILAKKRLTRTLVRLFSKYRSTKFLTLLLSIYSMKALLSIRFPKKKGAIFATGTTANEFSYIKYIEKCMQGEEIEIVSPSIKNIISLGNISLLLAIIFHPKRTIKYCKVISYFNNDDFITGCLRASFVGYYVKNIYILSRTSPKAVLVTSNYAADSCAMVSAAKSLNIPVIFYPHGAVTSFNQPTNIGYDIAIFSGKYGVDLYKENSPDFSPKLLFCGIKGKTDPLKIDFSDQKPPKKVGIFLTAKTNMQILTEIVDELTDKWNVEKILIRPHPVDLIIPDFVSLGSKKNIFISAKGDPLIEDVKQVDFAFVGNSSVHLEILKLGVPTLYFGSMDSYDYDINGFVKHKVVPSFDNFSSIKLDDIASFYGSDWKDSFSYFDAGYGLSEEEINLNIKNGIEEFLGSSKK